MRGRGEERGGGWGGGGHLLEDAAVGCEEEPLSTLVKIRRRNLHTTKTRKERSASIFEGKCEMEGGREKVGEAYVPHVPVLFLGLLRTQLVSI